MADIIVKLRQTGLAIRDRARKYHITWHLLYRAALYLLLFDIAYVFLFPFFYMIITSIKSPQDPADFTANKVPRAIEWSNYRIAFNTIQFWGHFKNALIIPTQTIIIPMYIIFSKLDLINTYVPLLVPTFFGFGLRGGLYIFIFRQFFIRLPHELEDEIMASLAMENEFFELFNEAMYMAATVICLLPILVVFAVVQRYFIQGVERTGLVE